MAKQTRPDRLVAADRLIVAERRLELVTTRGKRQVIVRFMRPELEPVPAGVWICPFEILGLPGGRLLRAAHGVDEVQALLGALQAARQHLRVQHEDGCQLFWEGQPDLGFPVLVGEEAPPAEWRRQKFRPPDLSKPPIYRHDG